MASFLARAAGLGGSLPTVNAAMAMNAQNAEQLGELSPSDYLHSTGDPTIRSSFTNLAATDTALTLTANSSEVYVRSSVAGVYQVYFPLDRPTGIFGVTLTVKPIGVCYQAGSKARSTSTRLYAREQDGIKDAYVDYAQRPGSVSSSTCHTIFPTVARYAGPLVLAFSIDFPQAPEGLHLTSLRLDLTPIVREP